MHPSVLIYLSLFVICSSLFTAFGQGADRADGSGYSYVNREHFTLYPEISPDSRTELRRCEQNRLGFQGAIIKAYFNHSALETYRETGVFEVRPDQLFQIKDEELNNHVTTIQRYLGDLDASDRTAVLVYDYEIQPGELSFCSWMVTPDEVFYPERKIKVSSDQPLSIRQRAALSVVARTFSRAQEIEASCQPASNLNNSSESVEDCIESASAGSGPSSNPDGNAEQTLDEISAVLLPPEIRQPILAGMIDRLVVLPAVDIGNVSFLSLPISDEKHLVDFASVIITDDFLSLIGAKRQRLYSDLDSGALVVSNPTDDLFFAGIEGDIYARLLGSEYDVTQLKVDEASETNVMEALYGKSLFFFSGHGLSSPARWGENFLQLSEGGRLTESRIYQMLEADGPFLNKALVVLSACQTGLGAVMGGTVLGLPNAWTAAGADQVVMSLWDVDDRATYILMSVFAKIYLDRPDKSAEDALRESINLYRKYALGRNHPTFWAGFSVYGTPTVR